MLIESFADEGFEVLAAPNADAVLVLCDTHPGIDVLLTDVRMPGSMDGMELARRVRKTRPGIAVLITSGFYSPGIQRP